MPKSSEIEGKDYEVLKAAASERRDTFEPWRGVYGRAKRLEKMGLLKEAGISVWGHALYVITDSGRAALSARPRP